MLILSIPIRFIQFNFISNCYIGRNHVYKLCIECKQSSEYQSRIASHNRNAKELVIQSNIEKVQYMTQRKTQEASLRRLMISKAQLERPLR